MKRPSGRNERVKLWRVPELGSVELMHAAYVTQTFPRHAHEGFAFGVIERGALGFLYRGENVLAPAGAINLANPGEVHTGHAADETGWTYRMFYLDHELLRKAGCDIAGRNRDVPFFRQGVIHDEPLAAYIRSIHGSLETDGPSSLERESRFLMLLTQLVMRHADDRPTMKPIGRECLRVKQARDYIEAHYNENVSLAGIAAMVGLSPFHFLRIFREETGFTPHGYLAQVRVRMAKAFLSKGWQIAATAFETGFTDQSHLTRQFKYITGVTPGQYRKIVQDRSSLTMYPRS